MSAAPTSYLAPSTRHTVPSPAQQGLWFQQRLIPGHCADNLCLAYHVTGALDVAALRAAWRTLVERHEMLRCAVKEVAGEPALELTGSGADLVFVDARADRDIQRHCTDLAARPFDLAAGGLVTLTVLRSDDEEHVVVLVAHRIAADESSLAILVDELGTGYAAGLAGRAPALPAPSVPYPDYARWRHDQLGTPGLRRQARWWRDALAPGPQPPAIPTARPGPAEESWHGGHVRFDWGEDVGGSLAARSTQEDTSPGTVLLAGFLALLARYGNGPRVAVGYPVTVRPDRPEYARVVGSFSDLLLIDADLAAAPRFSDLTRQVARRCSDATAHRDLPFSELVRTLNPSRQVDRIPLCNATFTLAELPQLRLPGAAVRGERVRGGDLLTDVALTVEEHSPAVRGCLEYRDSLLDPASATTILGQLRTLLTAALARPATPLSELPLETPEQTAATIRLADRISGAAVPHRPVPDLVQERADHLPDAPALAWDGESVSYRELTGRAAALAGRIPAAGAAVAIRVATGPSHVVALLGVLGAGAQAVCLGGGASSGRDREILAELRPACLVLDGRSGADELARWYRREVNGQVIDLASIPEGEHGGPLPPVAGGLDGPAYVTYTSGSTGKPKGIAQRHAGLTQFVTWESGEFGVGPGDRVAQWSAPGYDASLCQIFTALVAGATACPVPERVRVDPRKLIDWLVAERISMFETVPSFARQLLKAMRDRDPGRPRPVLRNLLLAGEPLPGELADALLAALPGTRLVNLYGPTETILATWHEITAGGSGMVPIGEPIPGRQVLVLDEQDRPCPAGVAGQLVIRSPYAASGYVGGPQQEGAFRPLPGDPVGCYRTGDIGRRRWDGLLEFHDRSDAQVKFSGNRIELTALEEVLAGHDSVAQCAIVPVRDRDGLVVRLAAYVVRADSTGDTDPAAGWRAYLRDRLGPTAPPMSFTTVPDLPHTLGGKLDRRRLPAPEAAAAPAARAVTGIESAMAEVWADLLETDVASVPPDDSFFALGGHSLLLPRLLARVRARFGAELHLRSCLADPTVAGLSALVAEAGADGSDLSNP